MDNTKVVVESSLGDQEVRDRCAVQHAVVMGQVPLRGQSPIKDVQWRRDNLDAAIFGRVEERDFVDLAALEPRFGLERLWAGRWRSSLRA